jgi:hypothetical protein
MQFWRGGGCKGLVFEAGSRGGRYNYGGSVEELLESECEEDEAEVCLSGCNHNHGGYSPGYLAAQHDGIAKSLLANQ